MSADAYKYSPPENDNSPEDGQPEDKTRSRVLPPLRVTPKEEETIRANAVKSGWTLSEYSRMLLVSGSANVTVKKQIVSVDTELKRGLEGGWNNLNQIAKRLNALDIDDHPKTAALLQDVETILGQQERLFDWVLNQLPDS